MYKHLKLDVTDYLTLQQLGLSPLSLFNWTSIHFQPPTIRLHAIATSRLPLCVIPIQARIGEYNDMMHFLPLDPSSLTAQRPINF